MTIPDAMRESELRRFPLRRRDVEGAGGKLRIVAPKSSRDLLLLGWSQKQLPHWADIWPASVAVARRLMRDRNVEGRTVVDLGCGVGVAGVAAGMCGARVRFLDRDPHALDFAKFNARSNGVADYEALVFDWTEATVPIGDLLILADLAYEFRHVRPLLRQIESFVAGGGEAWLLDPDRPTGNDLFAALPDIGVTEVHPIETNWDGSKRAFRMAEVRAGRP